MIIFSFSFAKLRQILLSMIKMWKNEQKLWRNRTISPEFHYRYSCSAKAYILVMCRAYLGHCPQVLPYQLT